MTMTDDTEYVQCEDCNDRGCDMCEACHFCGHYDCVCYDEHDEPDEDPLAGDVEPTGGYSTAPVHAFSAHRLSVMRQYGDYTG